MLALSAILGTTIPGLIGHQLQSPMKRIDCSIFSQREVSERVCCANVANFEKAWKNGISNAFVHLNFNALSLAAH